MLTTEIMLTAYANGIFPMAERRDSAELQWVEPRLRGVIPLDGFHLSRSLRRRILAGGFEILLDRDFAGVVAACSARAETWINADLNKLYGTLHQIGHAHSLEVHAGRALVGGVFGVTLGRAFFGESMFSRRTDASKIALAYLVDHLRQCGFVLFDTQFLTAHLASLGAVEIPRTAYLKRLQEALKGHAIYGSSPLPAAQELVQRSTQTS